MEVKEGYREVAETLYAPEAGSRLIFRLSLAQKEFYIVTRLR